MSQITVLINSLLNATSLEALKNQLVPALTAILQNGGGGSGITSITSTDGSVAINNDNPSAPDLSAVKLVKTQDGLTGTFTVENGNAFARSTQSGSTTSSNVNVVFDIVSIQSVDSVNNDTAIIVTQASEGSAQASMTTSVNGAISRIVTSGGNTIELQLENNNAFIALRNLGIDKIGFFNKATGANAIPQAAAIPDATNLATAITAINDLLAAMRAYGLIAE